MDHYLAAAAPLGWIHPAPKMDLEARVLTAYRLESTDWRIIGTYSDETEARIEPFNIVPLNIAESWPPAAPERPP